MDLAPLFYTFCFSLGKENDEKADPLKNLFLPDELKGVMPSVLNWFVDREMLTPFFFLQLRSSTSTAIR